MDVLLERAARADFRVFRPIQTRWADNDVYGHVNNVVYYAWFDTAVNGYLLERGLLRPDGPIFLVAETGCRYFAPLAFPDAVEIGLAVARLGQRAVTWRVGVFAGADPDVAAATGRFVHVCVDRVTRRPAPLPAEVRSALRILSA